jgi:hypothetical protein
VSRTWSFTWSSQFRATNSFSHLLRDSFLFQHSICGLGCFPSPIDLRSVFLVEPVLLQRFHWIRVRYENAHPWSSWFVNRIHSPTQKSCFNPSFSYLCFVLDYLESRGLYRQSPIQDLQGTRVGVDAINWLRSLPLREPLHVAIGGVPTTLVPIIDSELAFFRFVPQKSRLFFLPPFSRRQIRPKHPPFASKLHVSVAKIPETPISPHQIRPDLLLLTSPFPAL